MKKVDHLLTSKIKFIGEQDGVPERKLKAQLVELFSGYGSVIRAYLVRVDYGNPNEFNVALCIRTELEPSCDFNEAINENFANMFLTNEHLDVLFLTEELEKALIKVCRPFF